jgi:hypothetical protein
LVWTSQYTYTPFPHCHPKFYLPLFNSVAKRKLFFGRKIFEGNLPHLPPPPKVTPMFRGVLPDVCVIYKPQPWGGRPELGCCAIEKKVNSKSVVRWVKVRSQLWNVPCQWQVILILAGALLPLTKSMQSVEVHEPIATKYVLHELNTTYYSTNSSVFASTKIRANKLHPCQQL